MKPKTSLIVAVGILGGALVGFLVGSYARERSTVVNSSEPKQILNSPDRLPATPERNRPAEVLDSTRDNRDEFSDFDLLQKLRTIHDFAQTDVSDVDLLTAELEDRGDNVLLSKLKADWKLNRVTEKPYEMHPEAAGLCGGSIVFDVHGHPFCSTCPFLEIDLAGFR